MAFDITPSLRKSVGAIHHVALDRQLSLVAKKLFNVLLYLAHGKLLEREKHEVKLAEVCSHVGYNSHNVEVLKNALRTLVTTRIEWNVLGDTGGEEWGVTTALAEAKVANGVCTYAYSPTLRQKLANPHVYALINLRVQRRFTSTHSWSLYENLVRYRRVGRTPQFTLETLLRLLGLAETKAYQTFKYLKRDVLTPALEEINEKGDIQVELLPPVKCKRRIVALQFAVSEKAAQPDADQGRRKLRERLDEFNIKGREAESAIERHSEKRLNDLLDDVQERYRQGRVRKLREYTLTVLREADTEGERAAPIEIQRAVEEEQRRQETAAEEFERDRERARARELRRNQENLLQVIERGLSEGQARALEEEFVQHLEADVPFIYEQYRTKGTTSRVVRDCLHEFKVKKLLSGTEDVVGKRTSM